MTYNKAKGSPLIRLTASLILAAAVIIASVLSAAEAAEVSLKLSLDNVSIGNGEVFRLTANRSVSWQSSAPGIAAVDKSGYVKGIACGSALISASDSSGRKKTCKVTVKKAPDKIQISQTTLSLGVGEGFTLSSSLPSGTASAMRSYRTSNSSIVKMTKTSWTAGFTAVREGTARVTVRTFNGREASCKITVRKAPEKIKISQTTLSLGVGEGFTLSSSLPSGTASAMRSYRTSNSSIVKMTKTSWTAGFTAVREGTARVTVRTFNGREASCKITVRKAPASVRLDRGLMKLKVGQTASLSMIIPQGSACAARTFRTSDPWVVKMTKTNWTASFKAEREGIAYVTGRTYNGIEASCKIIVEKGDEPEMLAVWVPSMAVDMYGTDRSEPAFTERIDGIMKSIRDIGANTVIFQAHPFCDSLYYSEIFPSSHILSGVQGKPVSYDALAIAIKAAKKYGLKFHAWINPLRVTSGKTPPKLAENNPYMIWKNDRIKANDRYALEYDMGINLNPAYPEVRRLIIDGVSEIVQNYDIDGIQIDDYFYPVTYDDEQEYEAYKKSAGTGCLTQQKWRESIINALVKDIYNTVHKKAGCVFGISPQGNYENNYLLCADVRTWCTQKGYADYICPQMYVSMEHPILPFEKTVKFWRELVSEKSVRLYFGLALYKIGTDADQGTWLGRDDNIRAERELCRAAGANGIMLYSCEQLSDPLVQAELSKAGLKK